MQDNIVLDVNEDDINQLNRDLLATLLFDRTTRKNILWGTDDYNQEHGVKKGAGCDAPSCSC